MPEPTDPFLVAAPPYLLGTLSLQERVDFEAHLLSGCAECARALAALEPALEALSTGSTSCPPAPRARSLLLDLAEAPRLPLDLGAFVWEQMGPGLKRAIVRHDPERDMTAAILWARPGARYPPHRHLGDEGFLVLQGHCRDETAEYRAGSVAFKRPGSVHGVEFLPGEDCIGYVVSYGSPEPVE